MQKKTDAPSKTAKRTLLAAIDEFKRTDVIGLSEADRELLARFHREDYAELVSIVGQFLEQHRKYPDDVRRFIIDILTAWHFALEAPATRAAWVPALEDIERTKWCAKQICGFLLSKRVEFHDGAPARQLIQLLWWLTEQLTRAERELSLLPARLPTTRKMQAATAPRVLFMDCMTHAMSAIFCVTDHSAVAALVDIVFETAEATTADQVRDRQRKGRTGHKAK
jgi:hypothetical protein